MEHKEIDTATLRGWLDAGKKVNILDVRPVHERAEWHIPGSIHMDVYDKLKKNDPDALESIDLDRSAPVVTVCAGGRTSAIAADLLQKAGLEAYNLKGGMKGWSLSWNTASVSFENFEIIQFRRTGKGCLSYMITSGRDAMVVDASLPVAVYQEYLTQRNLSLKYVADTHIHADHLSRSRELAKAYRIEPSMPSTDKLDYSFNPIQKGTILSLGEIEVKAMHTPGHTLESTCYLVADKVLLTGDTLFTNGVGRPDLKANKEEAAKKARLLYQSLKMLLTLNGSVLVMPGHTSQPVAFDQKAIQASMEEVKAKTSLLREKEARFVESLLKRIPPTPENYLTIVEKNTQGDFSDVNPVDLEAGANRCAIS